MAVQAGFVRIGRGAQVKLFLGFLLLCFIGGAALWKAPVSQRLIWIMGLCVLVAVGFFFFNQI